MEFNLNSMVGPGRCGPGEGVSDWMWDTDNRKGPEVTQLCKLEVCGGGVDRAVFQRGVLGL